MAMVGMATVIIIITTEYSAASNQILKNKYIPDLLLSIEPLSRKI